MRSKPNSNNHPCIHFTRLKKIFWPGSTKYSNTNTTGQDRFLILFLSFEGKDVEWTVPKVAIAEL